MVRLTGTEVVVMTKKLKIIVSGKGTEGGEGARQRLLLLYFCTI